MNATTERSCGIAAFNARNAERVYAAKRTPRPLVGYGWKINIRYVKFVMMAFAAIATVLSLSYHVFSFGGQGILVFVLGVVPLALGAFGTLMRPTLPRWAAIVSALAFLVLAMKTTEGDNWQNVMLAAAAGLVTAVVLAIKPEKPR